VDYIVATRSAKKSTHPCRSKALLGYKNYQGAFAKNLPPFGNQSPRPRDGFGFIPARAFDALVAAYKDYNASANARNVPMQRRRRIV